MASKPALSALEIATNRIAVLATYRRLLRATRIAFNGDTATLCAARRFARQEFRRGASAPANGPEAAQGVEHAQGVAQILRENVVQGRRTGAAGEEKYRLKMHAETQRLDNETAGRLRGTKKSWREVRRDSVLGEGEVRLCGQ